MKLHEIVKDLKVRQCISRETWQNMIFDVSDYLRLEENNMFTIWPQVNGKRVYWNPKEKDILADDWFAIEGGN